MTTPHVLVVSLVDVLGVELARAAVDPAAEYWTFALYRAGTPRLVKQGSTPRIQLSDCPPMHENEIVRLQVRLAVPEQYANLVLWLTLARAWFGVA